MRPEFIHADGIVKFYLPDNKDLQANGIEERYDRDGKVQYKLDGVGHTRGKR